MNSSRLVWISAALAFPTLLAATSAGGCRRVIVEEGPGGEGGEGGSVILPTGGQGGTPKPDAGKDALDEFFDPGCPDAGPPPTDFQCDPYNQGNGDCAFGEGCYIYVVYPQNPCDQEQYGAYCAPEGWGQQGDPCAGGQECGAGLVCVVTGSGTQCVELCSLDGQDGCPSGFVCEPIDVEGFGGCL